MAAVRVSPSILIFKADEGPKDCSIVLTSEGRPFQVTRMDCPPSEEMPSLPTALGRVQKVVFRVDPRGPAREIHLQTDHPDQPEVAIKVVVLGESAREGER